MSSPFRLGARGTALDRLARPCWRKQRHASRGLAEAHRRAAHRRSETARDPDGLETYHCTHCGGWHVGHRRPKETT